jgi:hypothetical protein
MSGSDLSTASGDLAVSYDLAPRTTRGIACGANACLTMAQYCCTGDNGVSGSCMAIPQTSCGASEFLCDGPEDCPPADPICCVSSGIAQCTSSCLSPSTPMCHTAGDCGGLACCPAPSGSPYALCLGSC